MDKKTDKFAICSGLNFMTKITKLKTFVKHSQMKLKECPAPWGVHMTTIMAKRFSVEDVVNSSFPKTFKEV